MHDVFVTRSVLDVRFKVTKQHKKSAADHYNNTALYNSGVPEFLRYFVIFRKDKDRENNQPLLPPPHTHQINIHWSLQSRSLAGLQLLPVRRHVWRWTSEPERDKSVFGVA